MLENINWEQIQVYAENNIFLVFAACIVFLSFLIFLLSLSIRSSRRKKEKAEKNRFEKPLDEKFLETVIDKLKVASINTNLFIEQHEAILKAKEQEMASKNTAIRILEERIAALNHELESKGGIPMVIAEKNLWADPQLIEIWKKRVRKRLNLVLITGIVIGILLANLVFYLVLSQTRLLEIFISRIAEFFGA